MSNDNPIDKDRALYTQNHKKSRFRCPECVRIKKVLRQCKIYKNLSSLWNHFKLEHGEVSNLIFCTRDIKEALNGLSKAIEWGILPTDTDLLTAGEPATTSSSILFDGRPPRKDRLENLIEIGNLLKTQSEFFPNFRKKHLKIFIEKAIGLHDSRTMKLYFDCVTNNSKPDKINGVYDVTQFCKLVGL